MLTDDAGETLVSWYRLTVVAFASLECLREVDCRLLLFALKVEFVDAALGNH